MIRIFKNWRIALMTLPFVLVIVAAKLVINYFGLEFVTASSLFTSVVAGSIFLFGLILAGVLADYKESERLPAELVSSCESIYEEGKYCKVFHPSFNLAKLCTALNEILVGFKADVEEIKSRQALAAISRLTGILTELEKIGVSPSYVMRLKNEQAAMRKLTMRFYYIQRINFLPSAYILVQSIIVLVIFMLLFSKITPLADAVSITFILSFLFIYVIKLLKLLEKPFQKEGKTMDDVSLFLLEESQRNLLTEIEHDGHKPAEQQQTEPVANTVSKT